MKSEDRKFAWALLIAVGVFALEFAWFLFIGPAKGSPACGTSNTPQCDLAWWDSAAFWTAVFTFALTVSTGLLWWQTKRLAEGAEAQISDIKAQIKATEDMARAANRSADVAERSLTAHDRPYIFISPETLAVHIAKDTRIGFYATNYGRSPGVVKEIWAKLFKSDVPPIQPFDLGMATKWIVHLPLGTGEKTDVVSYRIKDDFRGGDLPLTLKKRDTWEYYAPSIREGEHLYFVVQVHYFSPQGNTHLTINSWELGDRGVFLRVDDPACHFMG